MRWHLRRILFLLVLTVGVLFVAWYRITRADSHVGRNFEDKKREQVKVFSGLSLNAGEEMNAGTGSNSKQIVFNMNTVLSDHIPLDRAIPDSRPKGCSALTYPENVLTISVVIPFHNEWPSVLLRTVHSLANRTPGKVLKQIILVDDASHLGSLKVRLDKYINSTFTDGLVKIVRLKERQGLIRARLEGFKHVTSEVVSFMDSHMEVNINWIQPLLNEIAKNPKTVAMAQLDYIKRDSLEYTFYEDYRTRYGFKWDMEFFETYFRPDQLEGKLDTDPLPGVLMVGPGFAVRSEYFRDLGTYDSGMKIWGGENIEFAWRVWMCGGQLLHVPCSRVGHVERAQPYSFPQGRRRTELSNYKRAAEVWMGPYKKYVFEALPGMEKLEIGNLDDRKKLKEKLQCKDFSWFLKTIWPELLPYEDVGPLWGQVKTLHGDACLDNAGYLFKNPNPLKANVCNHRIISQGFALTSEGQLRTTLHCVVASSSADGYNLIPYIQNCMLEQPHIWKHDKGHLVHVDSNTCLQTTGGDNLALQPCQDNLNEQQWIFVRGRHEREDSSVS